MLGLRTGDDDGRRGERGVNGWGVRNSHEELKRGSWDKGGKQMKER